MPAPDRPASARAALDRGGRGDRPAGLLRRHRAAQPGGPGFRAGVGRESDAHRGARPRVRAGRWPTSPSRSTRWWWRSRPPRCPEVIADAAERGCGGAVVLSAGFGEIAEGRGLERELREAAPPAAAGVRPERQRVIAVSSRAPMWGDSVPQLEPGGVAMISQSGNVAVNALGSRAGSTYHTVLSTGNQAVLDASDWLRRSASARRPLGGAVPRGGRRRREAGRVAGALRRSAGSGGGAEGGRLRGGARPLGAHRRGGGRPAGVPRRWSRRRAAPGPATSTSCWSSPASSVRRAAGPGDGGSRSSPARAATPASPPTRPPAAGSSCLSWPPDAGAAGGAAALRGDDRQPARLHGDDLGRDATCCAGSWSRSAPTRRSTSCCSSTTTPRAWRRTRRPRGPRSARGSPPARRGRRRRPGRLHPPRPDRRTASGELADRGSRPSPACESALAAPQALRLSPATRAAARDRGGGCPPRRRRAAGDGWLGETEAKELLRGAGIAVPEGQGGARRGRVRRGRRARRAGGGEGVPPGLRHKSEAGALALDLWRRGSRRPRRRLARLPAAEARELLVERMAEPGVEVLVAARRGRSRPGAGGGARRSLDRGPGRRRGGAAARGRRAKVEEAILSLREPRPDRRARPPGR